MTRGNPQAYGEASYWDNRYKNDSSTFDWYQRYAGLSALLQKYVPKTSRILMVGCGNAAISEDMVNDGYQEIVNIDISTVVIEAMQQKYQHVPQLKYMTMDVRDLSTFEDGSFDAVLDKGMLDSLLCIALFQCGTSAAISAAKMLEEVSRVLRGGSSYILVTYGDPRVRLPHLQVPALNWNITLHILPRPGSQKFDDVSSPEFLEPVPINEDGSIGPHSALDSNLHYIYVCTKTGDVGAKKGGRPGKK
ncbi:EEF1A lysine methyltransferase 4 isoform X1 [Selaginella moellendorffii]|uniref:EEF1A lysine methyltransferase 4 isoform X1 n=1 Tax=Selaginella moellendorffii TaxID=88036 RepID=UPI000D1CCC7B|nr:EEF1A lysine methyltransferase 4 isoform X1 [Selaginella moellendorffii]|eukprot:XP_024529895.1 EEF1A lysine methyltransferase 4 isoform X1 [Selaginella moellendorffii]